MVLNQTPTWWENIRIRGGGVLVFHILVCNFVFYQGEFHWHTPRFSLMTNTPLAYEK